MKKPQHKASMVRLLYVISICSMYLLISCSQESNNTNNTDQSENINFQNNIINSEVGENQNIMNSVNQNVYNNDLSNPDNLKENNMNLNSNNNQDVVDINNINISANSENTNDGSNNVPNISTNIESNNVVSNNINAENLSQNTNIESNNETNNSTNVENSNQSTNIESNNIANNSVNNENNVFESNFIVDEFEDWKSTLSNLDDNERKNQVELWLDTHSTFPLIQENKVAFIYLHSNDYENIALAGSFNGWSDNIDYLEAIPGTYLFWIIKTFSTPDRYEYKYVVLNDSGETKWNRDYKNLRFAYGLGTPNEPNSVINLSGSGLGHIEWGRQLMDGSTYGLATRELIIYLPPEYDKDITKEYPVLYMHDGQNIFDDIGSGLGHGGWEVNVTLDNMIKNSEAVPMIVVGIPNSNARWYEYSHTTEILRGEEEPLGGGGDLYTQFLTEKIIHYIDENYRTISNVESRAVMGSSMGGLISCYIAYKYNNLFSAAGCLSSTFWWGRGLGNQSIIELFENDENFNSEKIQMRWYLDSGGRVSPSEDNGAVTVEMRNILLSKGWDWQDASLGFTQGIEHYYYLDEGAPHNEGAWRDRIYLPLMLFFK